MIKAETGDWYTDKEKDEINNDLIIEEKYYEFIEKSGNKSLTLEEFKQIAELTNPQKKLIKFYEGNEVIETMTQEEFDAELEYEKTQATYQDYIDQENDPNYNPFDDDDGENNTLLDEADAKYLEEITREKNPNDPRLPENKDKIICVEYDGTETIYTKEEWEEILKYEETIGELHHN